MGDLQEAPGLHLPSQGQSPEPPKPAQQPSQIPADAEVPVSLAQGPRAGQA